MLSHHRDIIVDWGGLVSRLDPWRICVTGGRYWDDQNFVWKCLNMFETKIGEIMELGHGDADGVDTLARRWCERAAVPHRPYPADWETHGHTAGPIRNGEMLLDFKPEVLLVFPGNTGTTDCARQARKFTEKGVLNVHRVFFNPVSDPIADLLAWG